MSGYSKPAPSDADLLHGMGKCGSVLHDGSRHADITSSTRKGSDAGMNASLGRSRAASDYRGSTPEDVNVAPGQRTTKIFGSGRRLPNNPNNS